MSKALRTVNTWTPILETHAKQLGLNTQPLAPTHTEKDIGLILDRSDWVEIPLERWMVAYRVVDQRGQPVIAELRIFPREKHKRPPGQWSGMFGGTVHVPPGGLTARLLREVRRRKFRASLRELVAGWTAALKQHQDKWLTDPNLSRHLTPEEIEDVRQFRPEKMVGEALPWMRSKEPATSKRGRKGRTDLELARIAAAYEHAYLTGRQSAIGAVAKQFKLSPSQARDAVHRARIRRLLSPASKQGQGGGLLTPFGQIVLKQSKKGRTRHAKR